MRWRRAGALLVSMIALSDARAADLSVKPSVVFIQPGGSTTVEVVATGIPTAGIAGFQLEVHFDASVLAASDPNAGGGGAPFEPAAWLLTSTGRVPIGLTSIDNSAGVVEIAFGTEPGPVPPSGSGALVAIELTSIGPGSSPLDVSNAILADGSTPPAPLSIASFGGQVSAIPGVTDLDGDQIPENADGLGAPGDAACSSGATSNCDDNCPLLSNPAQADADDNGLGDACQRDWTLTGTAAGGSVLITVAGVDLLVATAPGQRAADVVAQLAAAINASPELSALGIRADVAGSTLIVNTRIAEQTIADSGLTVSLPLAPWLAWWLTLGLGGCGALASRRRTD